MKNILNILALLLTVSLTATTAKAQVILKTDTLQIDCASSDTFLVPISVSNFNAIGSFQFTLLWNPADLDFIYTGPLNPLLIGPTTNFGIDDVTFINQGKLTIAWTAFGGMTVPNGTEVFSVAFVRTGGQFTSVGFTNSPVSIEFTDPDGNEVPHMIMEGGVLPIDVSPPTVTCPANLTFSTPVPIPVSGIAPASISDNCDIFNTGFSSAGATVLSAPNDPDASGTVFNFGTSTVVYTVTDVGNNTDTCSFTVTVENSGGGDLTIIAGNTDASCGESIAIQVTTLNFDSIGSLQFSTGWAPGVLQFDSIGNLNTGLQLDPTNFGTNNTSNGFLAFAWTTFSPSGNSLPNNDTLFTIYLTVVGSNGANSGVDFGNFPTVQEAYSSATNPPMEVPIVFINGALTVNDFVPPVIVCPANTTVSAISGQTTANVSGLDPTISDNCGGPLGLSYTATGSTPGAGAGAANGTYNAGSTTVTYTVNDVAGNTASCSFTVNVDAGQILTLILDSVSVDCQGAGQIVSVNLSVLEFIGLYGLQFSVEWDESVLQFQSISNEYPGLGLTPSNFLGFTTTPMGLLRFLGGNAVSGWPDIPNGGTFFTINFLVLDANATTTINFIPPFDAVDGTFNSVPLLTINGNFESTDTIGPVFTFCPPDTTVNASANECNVNVQLPMPTATDNCTGLQSITSNQSDDVYDAGQTVVVYTATDSVGNTSTCSLTVTVIENIPPQFINCPDTITAFADTLCNAVVVWTPPIGVDGCGATSLTITSTYAPGDTFSIGETEVMYTVTDFSGNTATCTFLITVADTIKPVIICPVDIVIGAVDSLNCAAVVVLDPPMVSDNCDQNIFVQSNMVSDTFAVGQTSVFFTAYDDYGNSSSCSFNVLVVDSLPPQIICPTDTLVSVFPDTCGALVSWALPQTSDDCSTGPLTPTSSFTPGDFFPVGSTTVNYLVADDFGNVSSCSFVVSVEDTLAPLFVNCPSVPILIELPVGVCDTAVAWQVPLASDNCMVDTLYSNFQPDSVHSTGVYEITYTAVDAYGNSATCTFSLSVLDQIPPQLQGCPTDTVVTNAPDCGVIISFDIPTATDNCDPNPIVTSSHMSPDTFPAGTITTVVIIAQDASFNYDTCSFTITVNAAGTPLFTGFPMDTTLVGCGGVVCWNAPMVTGFCTAPDSIVSTHQPCDTFPLGTTMVTYTAYAVGVPVISQTFNVIWTDPEPPVIDCPEPVVVNAGAVVLTDPSNIVTAIDTIGDCSGVHLTLASPDYSDNCNGVTLQQTAGPLPGGNYPIGTQTVTYVATDLAGNTTECSVAVVVLPLRLMNIAITPNPGCAGDFVTLTVDSFPGANYTWTGPQGQYPNTHQITIVNLSAGNVGVYTVQAELNGCLTAVDTASVILAVTPDAVDDLNFSVLSGSTDTLFFNVLDNDIYLPNGAVINLTTTLPAGVYDLGNGNFAFVPTENASGRIEFSYQLCSEACPSLCNVAMVSITIQDTECTFIPNIFSPNGDGVNDLFEIKCLDSGFYPNNELWIYNQWGDQVYHASPYDNSPQTAWNGTYNNDAGKELPDGVYYYIFKPGTNDSPFKGFIQIFR
ncbi:MAG: HYR domain-containing protein [Lewinellaceae bacterium]|nr:HYR domain-containing protein [Lewinellaceae bacterium]